MNQEQALSLVRWLITMGGGYAVGRGWINADQIELIGGAAATLVPLGWSLWTHTQARAVAVVNAMPEVKGVVLAPTTEGRKLGDAVELPATVAPAGTAAAQALVNR